VWIAPWQSVQPGGAPRRHAPDLVDAAGKVAHGIIMTTGAIEQVARDEEVADVRVTNRATERSMRARPELHCIHMLGVAVKQGAHPRPLRRAPAAGLPA
jgi:hypothetical protein